MVEAAGVERFTSFERLDSGGIGAAVVDPERSFLSAKFRYLLSEHGDAFLVFFHGEIVSWALVAPLLYVRSV